jgi:hypothetical protein
MEKLHFDKSGKDMTYICENNGDEFFLDGHVKREAIKSEFPMVHGAVAHLVGEGKYRESMDNFEV